MGMEFPRGLGPAAFESAVVNHALGRFRQFDPMMACLSGVMVVLGIVHVPIAWWSHQPWDGAISWRKPILFGISGGLTLGSLAWVWSYLPRRPWDDAAKKIVSMSLMIEIGLITLQIWRGQPSHFNRSTWWNARIDEATLLLITLVVAVIGWITLRSMGKIHAEPVTAMSIRAGMCFLSISCALGYLTSIVGYQNIEASLPPERFGSAGVLKFPHGACLHAIQTLPLLVWIRSAMGQSATTSNMRHWIAAHSAYLAYAVWQTSRGLGRSQPDAIGAVLLILAGILSLLAWWPTGSPRVLCGCGIGKFR
jgi:hypothetical protein